MSGTSVPHNNVRTELTTEVGVGSGGVASFMETKVHLSRCMRLPSNFTYVYIRTYVFRISYLSTSTRALVEEERLNEYSMVMVQKRAQLQGDPAVPEKKILYSVLLLLYEYSSGGSKQQCSCDCCVRVLVVGTEKFHCSSTTSRRTGFGI